MNKLPIRVVFAGGGTGGHFYPALAIMREFERQCAADFECIFFGTKRGIESRLQEQIGRPLHLLPVRGLARRLTPGNLLVPFLYLLSLWKSFGTMRSFRPDLVVGTGGYVALPVLTAASWLSIPTALQEQNSHPGITTRAAAGKAKRIFLGFAAAKKHFAGLATTIVSGNPIRPEIGTIDQATARRTLGLDERQKTILVLGGSQGARAINQALLRSLQTPIDLTSLQLVWQTGSRDYTDVVAAAGEAARTHSLFPFDPRMELFYGAADIVIARAGALTLAELAAASLPAILIPYPFAAGDHQRHNADAVASAGAAVVIDERDLEKRNLLREAIDLINSPAYASMRQAAGSLAPARPAAEMIVTELRALLQESKS